MDKSHERQLYAPATINSGTTLIKVRNLTDTTLNRAGIEPSLMGIKANYR